MKIVLMCATLGLSFTLPTSAHSYTGNELLSLCKSDDAYEVGFCTGFIMGAVDIPYISTAIMLSSPQYLKHSPKLSSEEFGELLDFGLGYCPQEGVTGNQFRDIALKYLQNHPETRHKPAAHLIILGAVLDNH